MEYIKTGDSVHWYTKNGEPRHDATLREARKENLLPSVTSITKVIAAPGLENWKLNQLLLAALTIERNPGELDKEFVKRITDDSAEHAKTAAETGTFVHGWIAKYLGGDKKADMGDNEKIIEPVKVWIDEHVELCYWTEYVVTNPEYAGTVDALVKMRDGKIVRIDWKTQGIKDPGVSKKTGKPLKPKVNYYNTWPMQLGAYEMADKAKARNMNVVISSNPDFPGVWEKPYTNEEIATANEAFICALGLWRYTNKFYAD